MKNIVGAPVSRENFFDRQEELNLIVDNLHKGNSIYVLGPRRMGKTSLLFNLIDKYEGEFNFTYFDLGVVENDFTGLKYLLSKIFPGIEFQTNQKDDLNVKYFIDQVNKYKKNDNPVVLIFDEFPFFIEKYSLNGKEIVETLLLTHREIRQTVNSNIRFIYSGESSLIRYPLLKKYLNDLFPIILNPLSKDASYELIDRLSITTNIKIEEQIKNRIYKFTQGIPFNIQFVFQIIEKKHNKSQNITDAIIDEVINEAIKDKQSRYYQPPQNDSFMVTVKIKDTIDLTNKER
jgi:hypothetical protein